MSTTTEQQSRSERNQEERQKSGVGKRRACSPIPGSLPTKLAKAKESNDILVIHCSWRSPIV